MSSRMVLGTPGTTQMFVERMAKYECHQNGRHSAEFLFINLFFCELDTRLAKAGVETSRNAEPDTNRPLQKKMYGFLCLRGIWWTSVEVGAFLNDFFVNDGKKK